MELPFAAALAFANPLEPIVALLHVILQSIFGVVHNYGWSLIILAALIKLATWPLNTMQFKSMLRMQELSPKIKALQARYKNDKEKLNEATMALYKETGANPLSGCLPMLVQLPVLYSVFYAINSDKELFSHQKWLWIGSPVALGSWNHVLASSLAASDYVLLALYVVSMYFSVRFTSPPSPDPQAAQQQRIMAFVSPALIGYFGLRYNWPSGLIIYWLSINVLTMAQQIYLIRKYHRNPTAVGPHGDDAAAAVVAPAAASANGKAPAAASKNAASNGGSRAARRRRSSRR